MKLSFEDKESFKKTTETLSFNYRLGDSNAPEQLGSSTTPTLGTCTRPQVVNVTVDNVQDNVHYYY